MDSRDIATQFGDSLRKHREGRGLTQEDLAGRAEVSRAYYGRIERGEFNVTILICKRIADALGVTLSVLFEDVL